MDEIKIKFKDALTPGLILALSSIVISLILQFTISDLTQRQYFGYGTLFILFAITIYFGIQYRNQFAPNGFPYGKAFLYAFYIMIISTLIGTVFNYINWTFIDPSQMDLMREAAAEKLYQTEGLSEEQIEQAIEMQAKMMTPGMTTFWALIGSVFFSIIIALISALAFWRKPRINFDEN